jgi:hypothetical protein
MIVREEQMRKISKNPNQKTIALWRRPSMVIVPTKSILASVKNLEAMIGKLRKQQQQIIERADPSTCRLFLPLIEMFVEGLQHRPTRDELDRARGFSAAIRTVIAINKKSEKPVKTARK